MLLETGKISMTAKDGKNKRRSVQMEVLTNVQLKIQNEWFHVTRPVQELVHFPTLPYFRITKTLYDSTISLVNVFFELCIKGHLFWIPPATPHTLLILEALTLLRKPKRRSIHLNDAQKQNPTSK